MLNVSELTVDIQGSRILRGISLNVRAGELVCLLGRNGAGKTTTFRTLMGYLRPISGHISWDGRDLASLSTWQIAQLGIGFSPEESEDMPTSRSRKTSNFQRGLVPLVGLPRNA